MAKNKIRHVILHLPEKDSQVLADRIAEHHAEVIERRLRQSALSPKQQIEVIDKVLFTLLHDGGQRG